MKIIVFLALFAVTAAQIDYFVTPNDDLDVAGILANPLELKGYLDCYMDRAPCSDFAYGYKKIIPELVQGACRRCTDKQKSKVWRSIQGLKLILPQEYAAFKNYYDPENKYFDALEREVSKFEEPILGGLPKVTDTVKPVLGAVPKVADTVKPVLGALPEVSNAGKPVLGVLSLVTDTVKPVLDVLPEVTKSVNPILGILG